MNLYAFFGISLVGYLSSKDEKLYFMTNLSDFLFEALTKAIKSCNGNILIVDLQKDVITNYGGKEYPISIEANRNAVYEHVVATLEDPSRLIYTEESLVPGYSLNGLNSSDEYKDFYFFRALPELEKYVKENNISIVISSPEFALKAANHFKDIHQEEYYLVADEPMNKEGDFDLPAWNSLRILCREMQVDNEFPYTFAGVQKIPGIFVTGVTRPSNTSRLWIYNKEKATV